MNALRNLARFSFVPLVVACASKGDGGAVGDTGAASDTDGGDGATGYTVAVFDGARIGSDGSKPNFHKVTAPIDIKPGPYARVTLIVDLESTCYPFEKWATNRPPKGESWPADCDAYDRNFETSLVDPALPTSPPIELIRAITPFGGPEHLEQDVTDVFNVFNVANGAKGGRALSIVIPTYSDGAGMVSGSNGGWNVSAHLDVTPGPAPRNVLAVLPLFYAGVGDTAARDLPFTLPAGTTSARIEYRVTGHGGASDTASASCIGPAEEFCKRLHHVKLDGAKLDDMTPWRSNCALLCTKTPNDSGYGVPGDYCKQNPCGLIASVRAQRANWCPGSMTPPLTWTPAALNAAGPHTFSFNIDGVVSGGTWQTSVVVFAYGP